MNYKQDKKQVGFTVGFTNLFHAMADQGKAITAFREQYPEYENYPACRIEIMLRLKQLKERFFTNQ